MAKNGTFTIDMSPQGAVSLTAAEFTSSNFEPYVNVAGQTPRDVYRVTWINLGNFGDSGVITGQGLPMYVGQGAVNGSPFRYGDMYLFSLSIYCTRSNGLQVTKWRKIKQKISRTFEPAIVNPNAGMNGLSPDQPVEWLIPVLHQMMH